MPIFTYAGGLPPIMPSFAIHVPLNSDGTAGAQYLTMSPLGVSGPGGFGVPIVVGMSPQDVAALLSLPIHVDPDYNAYFDNPAVIVFTQLLGNTALLAPFNQGSGTVGGQTWAWQCSCELYQDSTGQPKPPNQINTFKHKTGTFVSNGASRTINLPWTPNAVWVKPAAPPSVAPPNPGGGGYRQDGMTDTLQGGGSTHIADPNGITFGSNAFTVGTDNAVNKNGQTYTWLAISDPNHSRANWGQYVGVSDHVVTGITTIHGDPHISAGTPQFLPSDSGLALDFGGDGIYHFAYVDSQHGILDSNFTGGGGPGHNPTFRVNNRIIGVGLPNITHVWVFGSVDIYSAAADLPSPGAVVLTNSPQSQTDLILGFINDPITGGAFQTGNSNNIANAGHTFWWFALNATTDLQNAAFRSGQVAQSGAAHVIAGLPFQPTWVVTQQYISFTIQSCWRFLGVQTGVNSNNFTDITASGVILQTTGITSIDAAGFQTGTPQADNGVAGRMVWFAFKDQFSSPDPNPGPSPGALAPQCPGTAGRVRWPYTATLSASAGTLPYTWAILYGVLPAGLVLQPITGVISGIPTTVGVYPFIIRVTDATLGQALISSVTCSITITDDGTSPPDGGGPPTLPPPLPTPPPTVPPTGPCLSCTTLATAITLLGDRLQDSAHVHWTSAELQRYLVEAVRTWNAFTGEMKDRGQFGTSASNAFYDLPTVLPTLRAYNVKDVDLITDIEYNLMEPPTPTAWTGTLQFQLADLTRALSHRRDRFLYETGMVVNRFVATLGGPLPTDGRVPIDPSIMTVRRAAFIPPSGRAMPLARDDEWSMQGFERGWALTTANPTTLYPIVYSVGVTPPLIVQLAPPMNATGLLDLLVISRAGVGGQPTPCLDPTGTPTFMGIPDDWTWVVKFGALAELLNQQGVTYDPQRAAYCEARWRHGILLAAASSAVVACQISGQPVQVDGVADADQYQVSWQAGMAPPVQALLAGNNLIAFSPVPDQTYVITLDVIRNAPIPAVGGDCLGVEAQALDAVLDYAQHLAIFKEGPAELQTAMDLFDRFLRATSINTSETFASVPNWQAILDQTRSDERQQTRLLTPPPIQVSQPTSGGGGTQ